MTSFATGFLTGFMQDQADKIGARKSAAEEFFNEQMKLAQRKVFEYKTTNDPRMEASLQTAKKMMAIGVPQTTVMAIINQNPDDLPEFYETVQQMAMDGVDMSNPDVYDSLIQIDGEFNPGNENVTSLLKRIYDPLSANAKADPKGWDFDPKGTMWATMLGYNAMEKAYDRLATSEVLPGISASAVLSMGDREDQPLPHPLGGAAVTLNAGNAGDAVREAKKEQRGGEGLTIAERRAVIDSFNDMVQQERMLLGEIGSGMDVDQKNEEASRRAAQKVLQSFPEAGSIPEVSRWLGGPSGGATAPSPAPATTPTPTSNQGSDSLPNGAVKLRDHQDGKTSIWRLPSGKEVRVLNEEVEAMRSSAPAVTAPTAPTPTPTAPTMQSQPQPGWMDTLGSEYD